MRDLTLISIHAEPIVLAILADFATIQDAISPHSVNYGIGRLASQAFSTPATASLDSRVEMWAKARLFIVGREKEYRPNPG